MFGWNAPVGTNWGDTVSDGRGVAFGIVSCVVPDDNTSVCHGLVICDGECDGYGSGFSGEVGDGNPNSVGICDQYSVLGLVGYDVLNPVRCDVRNTVYDGRRGRVGG